MNNAAITESAGKRAKLVYSMKEVAEVLGISYISVYRLLKRGKIKSSGALRNKIIPAFELDRFLRETLQ